MKKLVSLFAVLMFVLAYPCVVIAQADDSNNATSPAAEKAPEFKSEKAAKDFEEGLKLFKAGDYKDARSAFKKAARSAKTKEDRAIVEKWVDGAEAATLVWQVKLLMQQNKLQYAYQHATKVRSRCVGNAAEPLFDDVMRELEGRIFHILESFDYKDRRFLEKYGKTFIADPKIVFKGQHCLRWTNTRDGKPGVLKLSSVPKDLSRYDAIEFWVNYRVPPTADVIILCGQRASSAARPRLPPGAQGAAGYFGSMSLKARPGVWQPIRMQIPKDFKAQGNPSISDVKDLRFQIAAGKAFDFFIDEIRLMRKDPPAGQPSAAR